MGRPVVVRVMTDGLCKARAHFMQSAFKGSKSMSDPIKLWSHTPHAQWALIDVSIKTRYGYGFTLPVSHYACHSGGLGFVATVGKSTAMEGQGNNTGIFSSSVRNVSWSDPANS